MTGITLEQQVAVVDVPLVLDALLGRLSYDEEFAAALRQDSRKALADAGMVMEKEAVEEFIRINPERFDRVLDELTKRVGADFIPVINLGASSCD